MTSPLPELPALRHLGDLAGARPVVVVDSREQDPLPIRRLPTVRGGLQSGDYSVAGLEDLFAVERKTVADLVGCCCGDSRERFERELHRLRGFRFTRLLVVGTVDQITQHTYRSQVKPASVLNSLAAWEVRYSIPVVFRRTAESAAEQVETWAWWFAREYIEVANDLLRAHKESSLPSPAAKKHSTVDDCRTQPGAGGALVTGNEVQPWSADRFSPRWSSVWTNSASQS